MDDADRLDRKGRLSLSFDQIAVNGRSYPIRASVVEALESGGYKEDAAKIGAGAGVGAIIGGILGGVKGALAGILIGGGGVVAATEGKDVVLPAGSDPSHPAGFAAGASVGPTLQVGRGGRTRTFGRFPHARLKAGPTIHLLKRPARGLDCVVDVFCGVGS